MEHTSGKMEADGGFLYEISGNPNNRLLLEFGRYVSQEEAEANAERIRDLWNAFDGIPTHEAMNIIQVAQSLRDNPKDMKYLEHGKKMEACIKAERGRWRGEEMPWTREKTEELLAKLKVGE